MRKLAILPPLGVRGRSVPTATTQRTHSIPCTDIPALRDRLLANGDLSAVSSGDLESLHTHLESTIPSLLSSGHFVDARNYILLSQDISDILYDRTSKATTPKPHPVHPLLIQFDSKTDIGVKQITDRYSRLEIALSTSWQNDLRPEYFRPSQRVLELRKAVKQYPDDTELIQNLNGLEEDEKEIANLNFETEYDEARDRLLRHRQQDLVTFLYGRRKKRSLLLRQLSSKRSILSCKSVQRASRPSPVVSPMPRPSPPRAGKPLRPHKTCPQQSLEQKTFVTSAVDLSEESSDSSEERAHDIYDPAEEIITEYQTPLLDESSDATDDEGSDRASLVYGSQDLIPFDFNSANSSALFDSCRTDTWSALQSADALPYGEEEEEGEMEGENYQEDDNDDGLVEG